jgi:dienelactone hydrolase
MKRPLAAMVVALLVAFAAPVATRAQQAVRMPLDGSGPPPALTATFFAPVPVRAPAPAVAIFHGCGGIGVNVTRMAQRLAGQGIAALLVDSFGARGIRDACTRNWPTRAQAQDRTRDIDAAVAWLKAHKQVAADRVAVMGYSYGGGVVLMRALDGRHALDVRAVIAVYPDCALVGRQDAPAARQPVLMAMAALDDWTPVRACEAMLARVAPGQERIETRIYPGAHHSFDAVGLPVTWLAAAGNNSKPNSCCGAHYGYHAPAYTQFLKDLDAFLARHLGPAR